MAGSVDSGAECGQFVRSWNRTLHRSPLTLGHSSQVDHNATIFDAIGVLIEQRLGMCVAVEVLL